MKPRKSVFNVGQNIELEISNLAAKLLKLVDRPVTIDAWANQWLTLTKIDNYNPFWLKPGEVCKTSVEFDLDVELTRDTVACFEIDKKLIEAGYSVEVLEYHQVFWMIIKNNLNHGKLPIYSHLKAGIVTLSFSGE